MSLEHNPVRVCARCQAPHRRKHPYCPPCMAKYKRDREESGGCAPPGTPPPPPPGFNVRDMSTARPFGSIHGRESDWRDGPRPAGDRVNGGLAAWF